MMKILISLKKMPVNGILIMAVSFLYYINNAFFKRLSTGYVHYFMVCYFNDLICPLLLFSYINILLLTMDKKLVSLPLILLSGVASAFVWEFLSPLIKPHSVTDLYDFLCYIVGSTIYYLVIRVRGYTK